MSFEELWAAAPAAPASAQPAHNPFSFAGGAPAPAPAARALAAAVNPFAEMDAATVQQQQYNAQMAFLQQQMQQLQMQQQALALQQQQQQQQAVPQQHQQPTQFYAAAPARAAAAPPAPAPADPFNLLSGLSTSMAAHPTAAPAAASKPSASALNHDMLSALDSFAAPAPAHAHAPAPLNAPTIDEDPFAATSGDGFDELFAKAAQTPLSVRLKSSGGGGVGASESVGGTSAGKSSALPEGKQRAVKSPSGPAPPLATEEGSASAAYAAAAGVVSPRTRRGGNPAAVASPKGALDLNSFKALAATSPKALEAKVSTAAVASAKQPKSVSSGKQQPAIQSFTTRRIQKLHNTGFEYVISPMGSELEHDDVVNDSGSQSFARNVEKVFCRADIWEAPNDQFDVKGEWFADGHAVNVKGTLTEQTAEGQLLGFVQFTFPRGTNFKLRNRWITFNAPIHQWPPGNYHLKVSFGVFHTERIDFSIRHDSD